MSVLLKIGSDILARVFGGQSGMYWRAKLGQSSACVRACNVGITKTAALAKLRFGHGTFKLPKLPHLVHIALTHVNIVSWCQPGAVLPGSH